MPAIPWTPQRPGWCAPRPRRGAFPKLDMGIWQQPDSTVQWLRDTKLGMFIHWGVYAGPAKGEWYMHDAAITPANYQKIVTDASSEQFTAVT